MITNILHQQDKDGPVTMEDAAGFFANVFGGERFIDYVRIHLRIIITFSLLILKPIFRLVKSPS